MHCVIVGAAGFIGRHLGEYHVDRGDTVLGLDVDAGGPAPPAFPIEACDVASGRFELPRGTDVVYFLAQSAAYRSFPDRAGDLFEVNVVGALRIAEAARRAGARLLVYASTGSVYVPGFEPMREDRPVRRDRAYPLSKVCAEEALTLPGFDLPVLCPRLFGVFGPGQHAMLVPGLAERIRSGAPVTIERHPHDESDRDGLRISLTFVGDLVKTLADLVDATLAGRSPHVIVNIAGDEAISVRRLATELGDQLAADVSFESSASARTSDFIADTARLRSVVAPSFTPLGEAIARTLAVCT